MLVSSPLLVIVDSVELIPLTTSTGRRSVTTTYGYAKKSAVKPSTMT